MKRIPHFRLLVPHRRHCQVVALALSGRWDSPWWIAAYQPNDRPIIQLTKGGRTPKPGSNRRPHFWLVLCCNDPKCEARGAVRLDEVTDVLAWALADGTRRRACVGSRLFRADEKFVADLAAGRIE